MVPDLLGDDRIGYELDEIVNGVYGRVYALETLDLLADGQRVVRERRMAVVVRRTAVHCSVTLRTSLETAVRQPLTARDRTDGPADETTPRKREARDGRTDGRARENCTLACRAKNAATTASVGGW